MMLIHMCMYDAILGRITQCVDSIVCIRRQVMSITNSYEDCTEWRAMLGDKYS